MATLFRSPSFFLSFSAHRPFSSFQHQHSPSWKAQEFPPGGTFKICASSLRKPRVSRKVKSNDELCNEIREFVSAVGLPEGHVPSMKELSKHGRNDLANIVRRRGYKRLKQLLASSIETDFESFKAQENLVEHPGQSAKSNNVVQVISMSTEAFNTEDDANSMDSKSDDSESIHENGMDTLQDQNDVVNAMFEDVLPSTSVSIRENYSRSCTGNQDIGSDDHSYNPVESSAISTLEEKAAMFIQNGDLDSIKVDEYGMLYKGDDKESKEAFKIEDEVASQSKASGKDHLEYVCSSSTTSNGNKNLQKQVVPVTENSHSWRDDDTQAELLEGNDSNDEPIIRDNQVEIARLRFMLHQKELELSHLKEQIEKEKISLSALQTEAETEINKAQKLISEKDAELLAAEESLSGLQEVQIQYSGDGEIVEVAGSFNGWHHRIKMDPQPSSTMLDPNGSRKSRVWSTVLWLYPGIYEIKFIVDGQWRLHPQRESVTKGGICNNILRVNR